MGNQLQATPRPEHQERSSVRRDRPLLGLRTTPGRMALWVFRVPLVLYRSGRGWMLGDTFLAMTHVGRRTGLPHTMVAMVLRHDPVTGEVVIFSGWGPNADWVRNIRAHPAVRVQLGRESFVPEQRFLTPEESFEVVRDFQRRHPGRVWLARRVLGWPDLRPDANVREFISTRPFVAFRPKG